MIMMFPDYTQLLFYIRAMFLGFDTYGICKQCVDSDNAAPPHSITRAFIDHTHKVCAY